MLSIDWILEFMEERVRPDSHYLLDVYSRIDDGTLLFKSYRRVT